MLFNFQGPIRCRSRRQLRYYIIPSSLCQHLSPIFFSFLPSIRVFHVNLSTSCGKLTTSFHTAYLPCSTSPLRTMLHKIRAFCTNAHSLFCGKPQITVQLSGNSVHKEQKTRVRRNAGLLPVLDFEGLYCNLNCNQFNCREKPAKEVFASMSG